MKESEKKGNYEIVLVQKPVIKHDLKTIGALVDKRIKDLNIDKLVATEDTIQSMKSLRSELNKEYTTYETQRKDIDKQGKAPLVEFKTEYDIQVGTKYIEAVNKLKTKIGSHESIVKDAKKENLESYFKELCQSEKIDFLTFEKVGLDINLTTTESAYKKKCKKFVMQVVDEIALIKSTDIEVEVMVEYKISLNASKAIVSVRARKQLEKEESDRIKQKEYLRRQEKLKSIGMFHDEETGTYVFNDSIYVSWDSIKDIVPNDFTSKFIEFDEKIKAYKQPENIESPAPKKEEIKGPVKTPIKKVAAPISAPKKEEKLELVKAKFEVLGTMPELKKLGQYMKDNNLTYKNLK